jgi:hypothetical protein
MSLMRSIEGSNASEGVGCPPKEQGTEVDVGEWRYAGLPYDY